MDLIRAIREEYGLDINVDDEQAKSAIGKLTQTVENASQRLSVELYSKATHFVLEFIQNADDNAYHESVTPTLIMELKGRKMNIRCNETGFTASNVRAICGIGASTKNHISGYIGEKGIGFKSVFAVADIVRVVSGPYKFMFDKGKKLGMIAPIWCDDAVAQEGWTTFRLELSDKTHGGELVSHLQDVQPSLLLFLRRIHCMQVTIESKSLTIQKTVLQNGVTRIQRSGDGPTQSNDYIIFKHAVTTAKGEEKRKGVSNSEIVLAFPVTQDEHPVIGDQNVHAFLPLRPFGFNFVIQADFLTASNREDILTDREWNRVLRDAIPAAFLEAVSDLKQRPTLLFTWLRYIPHHIVDSFFNPVHASLISLLKQSPIIVCQDGISRQPSDVLILPTKYQDSTKDTPLIPSEHITPKYYISDKYDVSVDGAILKTLGVVSMSEDHFLRGLSSMERLGTLSTQSDAWWEKVCSVLSEMVRLPAHKRAISLLKLVPLADKTWSAVSENIYFDSALADIPQDVDLRLVKHLDSTSSRFRLLHSLGLREANANMVAEKIEYLHMHGSLQFHRATLPYHAQFIFKHRPSGTLRDSYSLKVITRDNQILPAAQVYMDDPKHASLPLSSCLALPDAHFLHADYDSLPWATFDSHLQDWRDWLHQRLRIAIAPRILISGLSPELRTFLKSADTSQILAFFKEYGIDLVARTQQVPAARKELRELMVVTSTGDRRPLESTYLARRSLARFADLPFLPLENPDAHHWDFLSAFGVSSQVDCGFYLKQLITLSEKPPVITTEDDDDDAILEEAKDYYKQLEAGFHDNDHAKSIRDAFKQQRLIYLPARSCFSTSRRGQWVSLKDVVWEGPPSMRSKYALVTTYDLLQTFFRKQVDVPDCPDDILLQELQSLSGSHASKPVDDVVVMQVYDILSDLHKQLKKIHTSRPVKVPPWFRELLNVHSVPVQDSSWKTTLKNMEDKFYVPDANEDLAYLFQGRVPMLYLPSAQKSLTDRLRIRGLLDQLTDTFKLTSYRPSGIKFNFLESVVKKELAGDISSRYPNVMLSERYQSKVPYISRIITKSALAKSIKSFLLKFQDIGVYEVDTELVDHTYTLGDIVCTKPLPLGIEITENRCVVLLGKACNEDQRDTMLCLELARLFPGLDATHLHTIFAMPPNIIEMLFPLNSVSLDLLESSVNGSQDTNKLDASDVITKQAAVALASSGLPVSSLSLPQAAEVPPRSSLTIEDEFKAKLSEDILELSRVAVQQSMSTDMDDILSSLSKLTITGDPKTSNNSNDLDPFEDISADMAQSHNRTSSYGSTSVREYTNNGRHNSGGLTDSSSMAYTDTVSYPSQARSQPTAEQEYTGIQGEIFAFKYLESRLPEFTSANWTSELRIHLDFPAFIESSIADFTYLDSKGELTGMLFGLGKRKSWQGSWPTYHLEVKTTSGPADVPFHISSRQLHYAQKMALRDEDRAPQDVYVLVRISSLRRGAGQFEPSIKMYPDPWHKLYRGGLEIASNVEMAIVTSVIDRLP